MSPPEIKILNPESLGKPLGQYSQITRVKASEFLFIAGQVGAGKDGKAPADFDAQCGLVFANIGLALASQGASFANIVEFTTYLVHSQDIPKFMAYRTREFPRLFPERSLSAQHAADDRPAGAGAVSDRGQRRRGAVTRRYSGNLRRTVVVPSTWPSGASALMTNS